MMQGALLPKISSEILQKMAEGNLPEKMEIAIDDHGGFALRFIEKNETAETSKPVLVGD
jgi:hypothetical protein